MVILSSLLSLAAAPTVFDPACADRDAHPVSSHQQAIAARDLARLRDIGVAAPYQDSVGLSVSPDGSRVAFQLREANPEENSYCLSMIVATVGDKSPPVVVDRGGDLIRQSTPQLGIGPYPSGVPEVIKPTWSPDGRYIAFVKRAAPGQQVKAWISQADGGGSFEVEHGTGDATDVGWSDNSRQVIVTSREFEPLVEQDRKEGLSGYHMDDRFIPVSSSKPYFRAPFPTRTVTVEIQEAGTIASSSADTHRQPEDSRWKELPIARPNITQTITDIVAAVTPSAPCRGEACTGLILKAWQSPDGATISYLRREGAANDEMALYRWATKARSPRMIYRTAGVLLGCEPTQDRIICAQELSSQPRRVVAVNLASGKVEPIFDPNPEFKNFAQSSVKRLHWRNDRGILTFGDLVLPPDHREGEKHPLVVVTYRTRGFLRGGVGDEYPIFALAARGYAVLSFDNPPEVSSFTPTKSRPEASRLDRLGWANRKSNKSSIEEGVRAVEALGVSDPDKRAITGLSDGSSSVIFALINSRFFDAAIV